jgi:hypothetical protein
LGEVFVLQVVGWHYSQRKKMALPKIWLAFVFRSFQQKKSGEAAKKKFHAQDVSNRLIVTSLVTEVRALEASHGSAHQ